MRIHRIHGRMASAYLIEGDRLFLVDTGFVGHSRKVLRAIRSLGRRARDLEMVVVTHAHPDHCGSLPELEKHADFDVACHPLCAAGLADGAAEVSPGLTLGAKAYEIVARASLPLLRLPGATATVRLADGMRLHARGLAGRVLHTPGHTAGCVSLLLDDGSAFVGDLITGPQGRLRLPTPTTMASDLGRTFEGWRRLLAAGGRRFFPAHGEPFSAEQLREGMTALGIPAEGGATTA